MGGRLFSNKRRGWPLIPIDDWLVGAVLWLVKKVKLIKLR